MTRRVLGSLLVAAIAFVVVARADNPITIKVDPKKAGQKEEPKLDPTNVVEEAAIKQQRLSQQYREFEGALLRLAQRLEASGKAEDREKAVILKKAIEKSMNEGVDTKFDRLVTLLRTTKAVTPEMLEQAKTQNKALADDIRTILAILLTDNREDELRKERERLTKLIERLNGILRDQKTELANTMREGMGKERLAKEQNKISRDTAGLARDLGKKDDKGGEKGASKGEGKKAGDKAQAKEDTNKPKGETKNPDAKKPGQENKNAGKSGEAKDSKGGNKAGESKDAKSGAKVDKQEKASAIKESNKKKEQDQPKKDEKADPKGRSDGKAEAKPGKQDSKDSPDGQDKNGKQQPGQSKGQPQSGRQQQPGQSKGDQQQQQQQQQQDDQQQDQVPARKKIEEAHDHQGNAEENIDKNKRPEAGKNEQDAIDKLTEAKKALEELLRQLREEEIERLLAQLQQRCERMLALQLEVQNGTVSTQRAIESNGDKKPSRTEVQKGLQLADREDEIVREAGKAIDLLKSEGSAVAFPEVFIQIRSDMMNVSRRLRNTDTGSLTQTIEQDIIDTLKEMIAALKKAQKDQQNKRNNPQQQSGQPQDDKLIDMIAELKMIRSLQLRVNARTKTYAREYDGKEQAPLPESTMPQDQREKVKMVLDELKDLANRQQKIFEVTEDIAKGRNK